MTAQPPKLHVRHIQRNPRANGFSLERVFQDLRAMLPQDFFCHLYVCRFHTGLFKRLLDALYVMFNQGQVNHVLGDVAYMTFFLNRHRTILTIADCGSIDNNTGLRHWLLRIFWFWLPEKRSTVITVISEATRQRVLSYLRCDPKKVRVIYCHVSEEFTATPQSFNSQCPRVLHVGTGANKNLERHAAALAGHKCVLVIVGKLSAKQRATLDHLHIRYRNVYDLSRTALLEEYRTCDMLLFASLYEGFGLPIVEAQAVGRPVITSNLWSMPEVAGDAACLVDPYDVDSIRAGIERVFYDDNYRNYIVARGYENVHRFSAKNIAAQYVALYREVARGA